MKVDWQRFDDGLLGPEERDRAIEALASDPAAKRELEGLRTLKATVREAALAEPVPVASLESRLAQVVAAPAPVATKPPLRLSLVAAAAIFAVLLVAAIVFWMPERSSTTGDSVRVSTIEEAQKFATSRSGMSVPAIDLGNVGKIQNVHAGKFWACYDYEVEGQTIHLGIDASHCKTEGFEPVETQAGTVYLDETSNTVFFNKDKLYYAVHGGDADKRIAVAEQALRALATN